MAVGEARLGLNSSMLARIGEEAFGRFIRQTLKTEGVDTSHLITDPHHLTGLAFLEISPPNHFPLLFYRENCADLQLKRTDADDEYLRRAKAFLFNGTCLSKEAMQTEIVEIAKRAKVLGAKIIFDIDYRSSFWETNKSAEGNAYQTSNVDLSLSYRKILGFVDLIVGTEEEFFIASGENILDSALSYFRSKTAAVLIVKKGAQGCEIYPGSLDEPIVGEPYPVTVLNAIGAGDAFMCGLLYSWFRNKTWQECARTANASGAIVVMRHGCAPAMPTSEELEYFLEAKQKDPTFESDKTLEALHSKIGNRL